MLPRVPAAETALTLLPGAVLHTGDDGHIIFASGQLLGQLGHDPRALIGQHIDVLLPAGGRLFYQTYVFPLLRMKGAAEELYLPLRATDGSETPVLIHGVRHVTTVETVNAFLIVPMRQRSRFERELITARQQAQAASDLRGRVLATVSHDLKNPLAAITGFVEVLQRRLRRLDGREQEALRQGLDHIARAADRMTAMMDELVDAARLEAGEALSLHPRATDLAALVASAVAHCRATAPAHEFAVVDATPAVPLVGQWDGPRLRRVLDNLLSNAVKYSAKGTCVTITLDRAHEATGAWARVSVRDEGIGIPAADLPHIFAPFRRAANVGLVRGAGIGLAGARQLVEQHGGRITVASTEGAGSTFTVWLPLG